MEPTSVNPESFHAALLDPDKSDAGSVSIVPNSAKPSFLDEVTVLLLTYNEAANIGRTLTNLRWARRILVVDSFSTDKTLVILNALPNVRVIQRRFDSFAQQCNFG